MIEYDPEKMVSMNERMRVFIEGLIDEFNPTWTELLSVMDISVNLTKQKMIAHLIEMSQKMKVNKWDPEDLR